MITYLAVPSAANVSVTAPHDAAAEKLLHKLVPDRFESSVQPKPQLLEYQAKDEKRSASSELKREISSPEVNQRPKEPEEFTVAEPEPMAELQVAESKDSSGKLEEPDASELGQGSEPYIPEKMAVKFPDPEGSDYRAEVKDFRFQGGSQVQSPRSDIHSPQSPLLAFAGDPVSIGMIVPDGFDPVSMDAKILRFPEPAYPVLSRKRGEEGRVILEVTISAQGAVSRAQVKTSSSHPRLDRAALTAVKKATFTPATRYGTPVESVKKVAYRFQLDN